MRSGSSAGPVERRSAELGLPSGRRVANRMSIPPLPNSDFNDLPQNLRNRPPLWFYVLREAEVLQTGERLGPVGARIVTEVFIGLLEGDGLSYLSQQPNWKPFLPTLDPNRQGNDFKMVDLLKFAGVA